MKKLLVIVSLIMLCLLQGVNTQAKSLSGTQKKRADKIVKICTQKYKKYGVLPSVCLGQAMVESGIGRKCRANNLWGLRCGRASYSSLESGTEAYLKCINNGYYKKAPFQKNYKKQVRAIVRGGYCEPAGNYYYHVTKIIRSYNLTKYDKKMFKELQAEKKAAAAKKAAKKRAAAKKKASAKKTEAKKQDASKNKKTVAAEAAAGNTDTEQQTAAATPVPSVMALPEEEDAASDKDTTSGDGQAETATDS